jgi:excisionase family DNA binding protein
MATDKRLLTCGEAATELGLKETTIRVWVAQRRLESVKLGRAVRIPRHAVERLIQENTLPARRERR